MEKIIYRKTLDMFKGGTQFVLQGVQTADNIAREVEISLASGGDAYDLPLSNVTACAYITDAKGNVSLVDCTIRNNVVSFCVPKITEAGVAEVTIKIIETSLSGAKKTIATPKFALEVWDSGLDDEDIVDSSEFTALENALARAEAVYDTRLLRIGVDEQLVFTAEYADSTSYESTAIRDGIGSTLLTPKGGYDPSASYNAFDIVLYDDKAFLALKQSVGITPGSNKEYWSDIFDLNSAIAQAYAGLNNETIAGLVIDKSGSRVADLHIASSKPTLVSWDGETANTPYAEGVTEISKGYAIIMGDPKNNHTITAWTEGADTSGVFVAQTTGGEWGGYKAVVTEKTLESGLSLGNGYGDIVSDSKGISISARNGNKANYLKVARPGTGFNKDSAVTVTVEEKEHKLYGEHNRHLIDAFGYMKMAAGSYTGNGKSGSSNPTLIDIGDIDFVPKVLFVQVEGDVTASSNIGICYFNPCIIASGNAYCDFQLGGLSHSNELHRQRLKVSWNEEAKTISISAATDSFRQMNAENETYHWIVLG
jgi:hypothetical protein